MEAREELETFTRSYIETALMDTGDRCGVAVDCDPDCNGGHEPIALTEDELHPDTLRVLTEDAQAFFNAHTADLALYPGEHSYDPGQWAQRGGELFWMDRSGHGVGFGDWYVHSMPEDVAAARERLMTACRTEGERELYRGDDGKIYHGKSWGEIQRARKSGRPVYLDDSNERNGS